MRDPVHPDRLGPRSRRMGAKSQRRAGPPGPSGASHASERAKEQRGEDRPTRTFWILAPGRACQKGAGPPGPVGALRASQRPASPKGSGTPGPFGASRRPSERAKSQRRPNGPPGPFGASHASERAKEQRGVHPDRLEPRTRMMSAKEQREGRSTRTVWTLARV